MNQFFMYLFTDCCNCEMQHLFLFNWLGIFVVEGKRFPSATCPWNNIVINQSDLKNKFIIFVKIRLTVSV